MIRSITLPTAGRQLCGERVERRDPDYLQSHPEFTAFVAWLLEHSLATYDSAKSFDRFTWQEKYMTPRVRRYLDARLKLMHLPR